MSQSMMWHSLNKPILSCRGGGSRLLRLWKSAFHPPDNVPVGVQACRGRGGDPLTERGGHKTEMERHEYMRCHRFQPCFHKSLFHSLPLSTHARTNTHGCTQTHAPTHCIQRTSHSVSKISLTHAPYSLPLDKGLRPFLVSSTTQAIPSKQTQAIPSKQTQAIPSKQYHSGHT